MSICKLEPTEVPHDAHHAVVCKTLFTFTKMPLDISKAKQREMDKMLPNILGQCATKMIYLGYGKE